MKKRRQGNLVARGAGLKIEAGGGPCIPRKKHADIII